MSRLKLFLKEAIMLFSIFFSLILVIIATCQITKERYESNQQFSNQAVLYHQAQQAIQKNTNVKLNQYQSAAIHNFSYQDYCRALTNNVISKYATATIEIPSVGIKEPVLEGVTNQNLAVGVVSVKPGQQAGRGNYALAGHNEIRKHQLLLGNLSRVKIGQLIIIRTNKQRFVYRVTMIKHNLSANHSEIINDSQGNQIITVYTCNNLLVDKRIFVRGKLIQ